MFQTIKYERKSPRLWDYVIIPLWEDRGNIQGDLSTTPSLCLSRVLTSLFFWSDVSLSKNP